MMGLSLCVQHCHLLDSLHSFVAKKIAKVALHMYFVGFIEQGIHGALRHASQSNVIRSCKSIQQGTDSLQGVQVTLPQAAKRMEHQNNLPP